MDSATEVANWLRIRLSAGQVARLDLYARELLSEGRRQNLTSLRDRDAIERRHFAESLVLLRALEDLGLLASPLIDIGTGAGVPGLPIAIARPDLRVTLLEATGKKADFLRRTVALLELPNVSVVQGRAEEIAHDPQRREAYPLALARAVAPLRTLVELALPFVTAGGALATPKGSSALREVEQAATALRELHASVEAVQPLKLPVPGPTPTLVVVRKHAPTPARYPRRTGVPGKRPL